MHRSGNATTKYDELTIEPPGKLLNQVQFRFSSCFYDFLIPSKNKVMELRSVIGGQGGGAGRFI